MITHALIVDALRDIHNPDICWSHSLVVTCDPTPNVECWPKHLIDESVEIELIDFEGLLNATPEPVEDWDDATFDGLADWICDNLGVWLEDQLDLTLGEAELEEAYGAQQEQRTPVANPTNDRAEMIRKIIASIHKN